MVECCAVQRRIGAADPALSVGANMHLSSMGFMVEHWKRQWALGLPWTFELTEQPG
ncbi:hypothetical protein LZ318_10875 [Saccharopolyspora indica]